MTVRELITVLQTYDGNKEVAVYDPLERKFSSPVVEPHSKKTQTVLVIARPWYKPFEVTK